MFIKRFAFGLLSVAVLSSLVGTAVAQAEPQQFVVVYVEFKPANARAGGDVLQQLEARQAILTQLTPLLEAPLDPRPGNLLTGTVNHRSRHAQARQIFVITHVDVDPQFVPQAQPLLNTFVADSLNDPGVQTFALLSQTPTPNHFQLIETFEDLEAFDDHVSAQHTVDFRTATAPFLGAPYDERLYQFVSR